MPTIEHTVVGGETLTKIANQYGVSVNDILEHTNEGKKKGNPGYIEDPSAVQAGQVVKVPAATEAAEEAPEAAPPTPLPESAPVWVYGTRKTLLLPPPSVKLDAGNYRRATKELKQIVLHCTASADPLVDTKNAELSLKSASTIIEKDWNPKSASANFIVEREPNCSVVAVVDSLYYRTNHLLDPKVQMCDGSIGVEIVNGGHRLEKATLDVPFTRSTLPDSLRTAWKDKNLYLHARGWVAGSVHNIGEWYYHAYQDGQYDALILLLRYLCAELQIPRKFCYHDASGNLKRYGTGRGRTNFTSSSEVRAFRGILSHCNLDGSKTCGGPALNRNRLYRGITDEWWLPVELDGAERPYYTGPYSSERKLVRWLEDGTQEKTWLFEEANRHIIDGLQDTRSYYDVGSTDSHYNHVEGNQGGHFSAGTNGCWHGGVHFVPSAKQVPQDDEGADQENAEGHANTKVYAAASGTIVAARLSTASDLERRLGSTRFVLIKHAVYPYGPDYSQQPTIVFTLYMHLASLAAEAGEHDDNPEWFNIWRGENPDVDISKVFCPNVEVMVGDHLGSCGRWYTEEPLLHFEVISGKCIPLHPTPALPEGASWGFVPTGNQLRYVQDVSAAPTRHNTYLHLSEWAIEQKDLPEDARDQWDDISKALWYREALGLEAVSGCLPDDGRLVHYHAVTFMRWMNELLNCRQEYAGGAAPFSAEPPPPPPAQPVTASREHEGNPSESTLDGAGFQFSV